MGMDLYWKEDIACVIEGLAVAHLATAGSAAMRDKESEAYGQGFQDALCAVARGLGLEVRVVEGRQGLCTAVLAVVS